MIARRYYNPLVVIITGIGRIGFGHWVGWFGLYYGLDIGIKDIKEY